MLVNASEIVVTFFDGSEATGITKESDFNTGLSVIAVNLSDVEESTRRYITPVKLANSMVSTLLATPVIAIGKIYGSADSVGYGMVVSKEDYVNLIDQNYELLKTNIYGSVDATGVIANTNGEILGIIDQTYNSEDASNLITAIGISELKKDMERMSNGKARARMGVLGKDVPLEVHENQGVPYGAYVTSIVMGTPAMDAGIQSGDIIIEMANTPVLSYSDFTEIMIDRTPDVTIPVKIMRQGIEEFRELELEITLDEMK